MEKVQGLELEMQVEVVDVGTWFQLLRRAVAVCTLHAASARALADCSCLLCRKMPDYQCALADARS